MKKKTKAQKREERKPKMKVSGKSVFKIKEILEKPRERPRR